MEIAHFFWHGAPLSIYENSCIRSFCVHGFDVHVWSYDPVDLPVGATSHDANQILPRSDLTRYKQDGQPKNIAAFTDFFRYELLSHHDGWWFDTDVLCLKPASVFSGFKQRLVVGYESEELINGAVLRINDKSLARELKSRSDSIAQAGNNCFRWGAVGPSLITELSHESGYAIQPVASKVFYPINWREAEVVLDPMRRDEAAARCREACCYHLWNEILRRAAIPKMLMPPTGSFLHETFVALSPNLKDFPALPTETFKILFNSLKPQPDPGFLVHARSLLPSLVHAIRRRI